MNLKNKQILVFTFFIMLVQGQWNILETARCRTSRCEGGWSLLKQSLRGTNGAVDKFDNIVHHNRNPEDFMAMEDNVEPVLPSEVIRDNARHVPPGEVIIDNVRHVPPGEVFRDNITYVPPGEVIRDNVRHVPSWEVIRDNVRHVPSWEVINFLRTRKLLSDNDEDYDYDFETIVAPEPLSSESSNERKKTRDKNLQTAAELALGLSGHLSSQEVTSFMQRHDVQSKEVFERLLTILAEKNQTIPTNYTLHQLDDVYVSDSKENTALHYAVSNGNMQLVKSICSMDNTGIDLQNAIGESPLFIATEKNYTEIFKTLLANGADPYLPQGATHSKSWSEDVDSGSRKMIKGQTCLHMAVENGNMEIVKAILNNSLDGIDILNSFDESALIMALRKNYSQIFHILLENGADPYLSAPTNKSPLKEKEKRKDGMPVIDILMLSFTEGIKGKTALHVAAENGNVHILNTILNSNKSGINAKDGNGNTPVLNAVFSSQKEIIKVLLSCGADPNAGNWFLLTPLHAATTTGSLAILETIYNYSHPKANLPDRGGNTPLHYAAILRNRKLVTTLLKRGHDPTFVNNEKRSPLYFSASDDSIDIAQVLLTANKSLINLQDVDGNTALHVASIFGKTEMVCFLLRSGADPNKKNAQGKTCLHAALEPDLNKIAIPFSSPSSVSTQMIQCLFKFGADPYMQDLEGRTTLHTSAKDGNSEIVELILNHTNKGINIRNVNNFSALHSAIFYRHTDVAEILLKNGADPYVEDVYKRTALHLAIVNGDLNVTREIITRNQTGVNIKDINGLTAIMYTLFAGWYHNVPPSERHHFMVNDEEPVFVPVGLETRRTIYGSIDLSIMSVMELRRISYSLAPFDLLKGGIPMHFQRDMFPEEFTGYSSNPGVVMYSRYSTADLLLGNGECSPFIQENEFDISPFVDLLLSSRADFYSLDSEGNTIFHLAAKSKGTEFLNRFSNKKKLQDLTAKNNKGETPLHVAVRYNELETSKYLLENGADPYIADENGRTALHAAVEVHDLPMVQLILNNSNSGVNLKDKDGLTALSLAIAPVPTTAAICELLLKNDADPFIADNAGHTSLHAAVVERVHRVLYRVDKSKRSLQQRDYSFIGLTHDCLRVIPVNYPGGYKELQETPFDIESIAKIILKYNSSGMNMKSKYGYTALFLASLSLNTDDVRILLDSGANPYVADDEGRTSLHAAILGVRVERFKNALSVRKILDTNTAGMNMEDVHGVTALQYAILFIDGEVVKELLKHGADPNNYENKFGLTPFQLAITTNNPLVYEPFLDDSKTDINITNEMGKTALHLVISQYPALLLVSKGADVQKRDIRGWTILHHAAYIKGDSLISKILSTNKTNVDEQTFLGETALSIALTIPNNHYVVFVLLRSGANPNLVNDNLNSPLEIAATKNDSYAFRIILERGGYPLEYNIFGYNAFHVASGNGNIEIVNLILEKFNSSVNSPDREGHVPIHFAAKKGHSEVLEKLINEGANPFLIDNYGHNVLHYAAEGSRRRDFQSIYNRCVELGNRDELRDFVNKRNFLDITPLEYSAFSANQEGFDFLWNLRGNESEMNDAIIFPAALGGDTEIIRSILDKTNISVKDKTVTGLTPVMAAAARGRKAAFDLFLERGASVDDVTHYGQSLLHFAASGGNPEILNAVLANSWFDVNSMDVEGYTPLMNAVLHDNNAAVDILIRNDADPELINVYGEDSRIIGAKFGKKVLESSLYSSSDNPDSLLGVLLNRNGLLCEEKIPLDLIKKSSLQRDPVFLAAAKGDIEMLRRFFRLHNATKSYAFPNLMKEIMRDFDTIISDLTENDNPSHAHQIRLNPLNIALLFRRNIAVVNLLFAKLGRVSFSQNHKYRAWTPFDYAMFAHTKCPNKDTKEVLLFMINKYKHTFNQTTSKYGWTVAHKAAWIGSTYATRFLKYYRVDFDSNDIFGRTPLHMAAINGHSQIVNIILRQTKNSLNSKDIHGFTPSILSQVYNHRKFFRRFSTVLSDMPPRERFSVVELSDFVSEISRQGNDGYFQTLATLIAFNADINTQDKAFGWTALHWAVAAGDYQTVQLLIYKGASVNIASWAGETPMFLARKWMRKGIYNYLMSKNAVW